MSINLVKRGQPGKADLQMRCKALAKRSSVLRNILEAPELSRTVDSAAGESLAKRDLIERLIQGLAAAEIRYCHWKSNYFLPQALLGQGDLDLLVSRSDVENFERILAQLGFKRVLEPALAVPGVVHFFGLDGSTGQLIHLHVYYRLMTGGNLIKSFCLPLEEMLLANPRLVAGLRVASYDAELIIFVLRAMLKSSSLMECLLFRGGDGGTRAELEDLAAHSSLEKVEALLRQWLPSVEPELFVQCLTCLRQGGRRFRLARKLRRRLKCFRRYATLREVWLRYKTFFTAVYRRLRKRGGTKTLVSGGAVIALVGPDASGKSTLAADIANWLGKVFQVRSAHLGKPPSTWRTFLPNLAGRLVRFFFGGGQQSAAPASGEKKVSAPGLLFKIRAVLLAWDRLAYATALGRQSANGCLVICDRYPSPIVGAMDSARLGPDSGFWGRLEHALYQRIPPPDILVQLHSPVEVALERNRQRAGSEPAGYLLHRHSSAVPPTFANARVVSLSTNQSKEETILKLRRLLWENV